MAQPQQATAELELVPDIPGGQRPQRRGDPLPGGADPGACRSAHVHDGHWQRSCIGLGRTAEAVEQTGCLGRAAAAGRPQGRGRGGHHADHRHEPAERQPITARCLLRFGCMSRPARECGREFCDIMREATVIGRQRRQSGQHRRVHCLVEQCAQASCRTMRRRCGRGQSASWRQVSI